MSQFVENMNVEEISTRTADDLLEELELPVIEGSIRDQIQSGFQTSRDFLGVVLEKFQAINEHAEDDAARGIRSEIVDWANSLIHVIVDKYDLAYNALDEDSLETLDLLEALYNFFVLQKRENTIEFYKRYIDIHKREIIDQMDLTAKGGDITTIANKKKNIQKDNIPILSNLDEVIRFVVERADVSTDEFLEVLRDGDFYIEAVIEYFEDQTLIGEIVKEYVSSEVGAYSDDISMELRSALRTHLANI